MPSGGMRRTTRVFGVVKGVDGARVLRSGRRLWPDSGESKLRRTNYGDDWYLPVIKKSGGPGGPKCKPNGWAHLEELNVYENDEKEVKLCKRLKEVEKEMKGVDLMYGKVYSRKRKRNVVEKSTLFEEKMYGIQFFRRQRKKKSEQIVPFSVFGVCLESSCSELLVCLLNSVLGYMKRAKVVLSHLASLLLSDTISGVFSSQGIRFLWDPPFGHTGMCRIFGTLQLIPLFSLDFSAVPSCFLYIHRCMHVRFMCLPSVNNSVSEDDSSEEDVGYVCEFRNIAPVVDMTVNRMALHPSVRASKLVARNVHYRNALNARAIQKRRSSLRRRRGRNPSLIGSQKAYGGLVSDVTSRRKSSIPLASAVSKNKRRSSLRHGSAVSIKEVSSTIDMLMPDLDPSCCCASVLVMKSDRCYRVEGANIMLEMASSKEWHLVVKKDGETLCSFYSQSMMRPSSCNRFTHAIIWAVDENSKLEFSSRQDWLNFKDLYKACSDRNAQVSIAKVIPIPGVREVLGYEDSKTVPFCRPDSYISINDDEVSRALEKRTANYDMDSEDEEWLKMFNNELLTENEQYEHVQEDNFELIVDAFEKTFFGSPDNYSNEEAVVNLCLKLGRREVVLAVYDYWKKKRRQKGSALLRVFQGRQPKKPSLIPKPVLRKRRSIKRQASQSGRVRVNLLPEVVTQQDALEEQNIRRRVEEAKGSAKRSLQVAVLLRRRAQLFMQNADLATYKAMMALRIAEAARVAESADVAAAHFLD